MLTRWKLHNPLTHTTATWPRNPRDGALPELARQVEATSTTQGAGVVFETPAAPQSIPFSGSCGEQAHHQFFRDWMAIPSEVIITDDLGQSARVLLTSWKPKRRIRPHHPWSATYDGTMLFLGWTEDPDAP